MRIRIKKGLDIPIAGAPEQSIDEARPVSTAATIGFDAPGLRPGMSVALGDRVKLGQTLFVDKRNPEVRFTAQGAGEVVEINRGARRILQSVVVRLDGDEAVEFEPLSADEVDAAGRDRVVKTLLESGLWTTIRTRPFGRIPASNTEPAAIFVTAMDTNPLAADPAVVIKGKAAEFALGVRLLGQLTSGSVYVCTAPDSGIGVPEPEQFKHAEFAGPHPAGLPGTHIHFLCPVSEQRTAWHIGYQHVIAIGGLFMTGRLPTERVVALCGPKVKKPRLVRSRMGACIPELLADEVEPGPLRAISGSVLAGHRALGPLGWLGRYHTQVTVLQEGAEREFLAWARPGIDKYSSVRAYLGHLLHRRPFDMTTTQNGSLRAMVSTGAFESIMPLDLLATPLLKALVVGDSDRARELGCLELDDEDLALCSFVCNGKYEYGPMLRMNLDEIEANG